VSVDSPGKSSRTTIGILAGEAARDALFVLMARGRENAIKLRLAIVRRLACRSTCATEDCDMLQQHPRDQKINQILKVEKYR
jgi:hypothetical protein